jgi:hypothetical protein
MKAYLLDPLAPEVLSCEKRVLPAWESTRNQRREIPGSSQQQSDAQRVELLKRQKERDRMERERAVWREASSAPQSADPGTPQKGGPSSTQRPKGSSGTPPGRRWKFR